MHAEGLVLPELDLGWDEAVTAPMGWARNIVIITIDRADFGDAGVECLARVEGAGLI